MYVIAAIDWVAVGSIATAISVLGLFVSLILLLRQLREMSKATHANTYIAAMGTIQSDDVRASRRYVLCELREIPLDSWNEADKKNAERVCHTYDTICRLARYGLFPDCWLFDSSSDSLIKCWKTLSPLVMHYRQERGDAMFWDDFEWAAEKAIRYKNKCQQ